MKYAMFGDSHAQAVFPVVGQLLSSLGHDVLAKPMAGWTLRRHLDDGLDTIVSQFKPDVLLLSLGGNNQDLTDNYRQNIDEVLSIARQNNVRKVVWVSPAWSIRDDVQKRHEWTSNYLKSNLPRRVKFVDIRPITKDGHRSDGVHFTSQKYNQWAELVSKYLLPNAITQIHPMTWIVSGSIAIIGLAAMIIGKVKK